MVASYFTQFLLLTWKNIVLQRRKVCVTVFEIVLPLALPILLKIIRGLGDVDPKLRPATVYQANDYSIFFDFRVLYSPNTTLLQNIMNETGVIINGIAYTTPSWIIMFVDFYLKLCV